MRILLADDQAKVRFALNTLLQRTPELIIVGEASDADELLAILPDSRPDVIIIDWLLPGLVDIGSVSGLRAICSNLVVIAMSGRPEVGQAALGAGADAFISKIDPPERLLDTITQYKNQLDGSQDMAPVRSG